MQEYSFLSLFKAVKYTISRFSPESLLNIHPWSKSADILPGKIDSLINYQRVLYGIRLCHTGTYFLFRRNTYSFTCLFIYSFIRPYLLRTHKHVSYKSQFSKGNFLRVILMQVSLYLYLYLFKKSINIDIDI